MVGAGSQKRLGQRLSARVALLGLAALALVAVAANRGLALGRDSGGVVRVRTGGDAVSTRIVVELDRSARGRVSQDPGSGSLSLFLEGVPAGETMDGQGSLLVRRWKVEASAAGARLAVELRKPANIKRRFLLPPGDGVEVYRYVVDLEAIKGATDAPSGGEVDPRMVAAPPSSSLGGGAAALDRNGAGGGPRPLIVIDAGHGGYDAGASGRSGVEKTLTLAAARDLKTLLKRSGRYRVLLTRDSDVYIGLDDRVRIAREAGADLFISLHADYGSDPSIRGASVYTLSQRGADRAARQALEGRGSAERRTGGGADWLRGVDLGRKDPQVTRILFDLTQRTTQNRSAIFARGMVAALREETPLLQNSHRDAGYAVLLAPDVPAVLVEMGFITNPDDEARLRDPARRRRLMAAAAGAVDDYFDQAREPLRLADAR